ncbi:hypothetical protein VNI00_001240 [Paramarasmius palmivorus]|uniref:Uncharacterized protein n=1 Tax=Paramarasmius palmivorus TaxID=297713 RepID=A0AAW0E7X9_9AGAR
MIPTSSETAGTSSNQHHSFEERLKSSALPPPGPSHFVARRQLWLTPPDNVIPNPSPPSTTRQKLDTLLSTPNAVNNNEVWKGGVEKVWHGLYHGSRLKKRLPLGTVVSPKHLSFVLHIQLVPVLSKVKIIHCAWVRDETWPANTTVPDSDDALQDNPTTDFLLGSRTGANTQGSGTPWTEDGADIR